MLIVALVIAFIGAIMLGLGAFLLHDLSMSALTEIILMKEHILGKKVKIPQPDFRLPFACVLVGIFLLTVAAILSK